MFFNYIRLSLRNLLRDNVYSFINIGGLGLGIAASILLMLWVQDELGFDGFHSNSKSIYRVNATFDNSGTNMTWPFTPATAAVVGKQQVKDIEDIIRISEDEGTILMEAGDKKITENEARAYVDDGFFTMFDFPLVKGNPLKPFPTTKSVIVSETLAAKFFTDGDAMGKTIKLSDKHEYTIVGIIKDMPKNSTLQYSMLFPFQILIENYRSNGYWKSLETDWGNYDYITFFQLRDGASADSVVRQLTNIHHSNQKESASLSYLAQPLENLHLYGPDLREEGIQTVRIFFIVAIAIMLIACINYINLATARATKRAKEVGVRKTIGADRRKLIAQFLIESSIISVLALFLSFVIIQLAIPFYNELSGKTLVFSISDKNVMTLVLSALLITWLTSGIYPALVLSAFKPMEVIRGKLTISGGNSTFRKILVVTQFSLSIVIIIGTMVVGEQLDFIRNRKLGFDKENIFTFGLRGEMYKNVETIKHQLRENAAIEAVTLSNQNILSVGNTTGDTDWEGKAPDQDFMIHAMNIDENFMPTLNMEIVDGRGFTGAKSDTSGYILNETAVKEAGITDPIGKTFSLWNTKGTIIGVVKDFHHQSIHKKIEPSIFFYNKNWLWLVYVKTDEKNNQEAIAAAEKIWKQYNPIYPFEYKFMDATYDKMYQSEQRMRKLFTAFSAIAICISCLGLFGLATFTATQRVKEIGIRKVMGATINQIVLLLSKDFLLLVVLAFILAAPISYFAMNQWLQDFAYRTEIPLNVYVITGAVVIVLAFATVSFQTIKAALGNPVNSLRNE